MNQAGARRTYILAMSRLLPRIRQFPRMETRSIQPAPKWSIPIFMALLMTGLTAFAAPVDQLRFGTQMAERGLWSEALFRFRQAQESDPDNPKILNNIAVSLEALGMYDEALEVYREAVETGPGLEEAKRNYARFVEFYQAYKGGEANDESEATELAEDDADGEAEVEEAVDEEPADQPEADGEVEV